jgi:hypothetical protein
MTAYTPGPWVADKRPGVWLILRNDHDELWLGEVWSSEADARVVAAAPELLEQLENLARVCEGVCHGWPGGDPFAAIAKARALIVKTKGNEQ